MSDTPAMILPLQPDPLPLREDGDGGFRLGNSRVPLDLVLNEFAQGTDPESIAHAYPTLQLADVYAVIAYYLRHREEVNAHLRQREEEAAQFRREIESRQSDKGKLREKLLARRCQQKLGHARSGREP